MGGLISSADFEFTDSRSFTQTDRNIGYILQTKDPLNFFKAKNGAILEQITPIRVNQITGTTSDFKIGAIKYEMKRFEIKVVYLSQACKNLKSFQHRDCIISFCISRLSIELLYQCWKQFLRRLSNTVWQFLERSSHGYWISSFDRKYKVFSIKGSAFSEY